MPETDADLFTMTWEEAEAAFERADAALLPTGSIEQHSVHLPTSVDTLRADHLTAELVEAAPAYDLSFVRLPTVRYGYSEHHMNFPGTVTLSQDTYKQAILDIAESVNEHGADRLLIVNCHGGNREPLALAVDRIQRDLDLPTHFVHWTDPVRESLNEEFGEGFGHAGDHETSVIELYRPDLVKAERKEPQNAREFPKTRSYAYFDDVTELGGLGDPTNSDPEAMEEIIAEGTRDILEALTEDIEAGW